MVEVQKFRESNENDKTILPQPLVTEKAMLRGNFTGIIVFIRK
jgi:hypothetical protein